MLTACKITAIIGLAVTVVGSILVWPMAFFLGIMASESPNAGLFAFSVTALFFLGPLGLCVGCFVAFAFLEHHKHLYYYAAPALAVGLASVVAYIGPDGFRGFGHFLHGVGLM